MSDLLSFSRVVFLDFRDSSYFIVPIYSLCFVIYLSLLFVFISLEQRCNNNSRAEELDGLFIFIIIVTINKAWAYYIRALLSK